MCADPAFYWGIVAESQRYQIFFDLRHHAQGGKLDCGSTEVIQEVDLYLVVKIIFRQTEGESKEAPQRISQVIDH